MFKPTTEIIADSVNQSGDRLTTFVLTYHRFIHSEFMTHRMLSKNSSSSRAIPVERMIKIVEDAQVEPTYWGANCKGMSAKEEMSDDAKYLAKSVWDTARQNAIQSAKHLVQLGAHKQIVNRLLEPFAPITVICTGTEYQNFFDQRCHPDAQPEIQALAIAMKDIYDTSEPLPLETGYWHIPFITPQDTYADPYHVFELGHRDTKELLKIATGRCARVSYLNHDGDRDINDDIKLHDRLLSSKPAHLSPFEHCAITMPNSDRYANFTGGWRSYRHILEQKTS